MREKTENLTGCEIESVFVPTLECTCKCGHEHEKRGEPFFLKSEITNAVEGRYSVELPGGSGVVRTYFKQGDGTTVVQVYRA